MPSASAPTLAHVRCSTIAVLIIIPNPLHVQDAPWEAFFTGKEGEASDRHEDRPCYMLGRLPSASVSAYRWLGRSSVATVGIQSSGGIGSAQPALRACCTGPLLTRRAGGTVG